MDAMQRCQTLSSVGRFPDVLLIKTLLNQKWTAIYGRASLPQRPKGQADNLISEASSTDDKA
jgi:hypothetical protein